MRDDIWVGLSTLAIVASTLVLMLASLFKLGSYLLYLILGVVLVLALVALVIRAKLRTRDGTWTAEDRQALDRRNRQQFKQVAQWAIPTILLFALSNAVDNFLKGNTLPQWLGVVLSCLMAVAWFADAAWIWWILLRNNRSSQPT